MENKIFTSLKCMKLSLLSRKGHLVSTRGFNALCEESIALINDEVAWLDKMISSIEVEMEKAIIPDIPF
jgi:hypothetical protein